MAVTGEETLYEKDYLPQIQAQVYKIRMQEYELRLKSLEEAINKKLLLAAAQKRGITAEALLQAEADSKVAEPTDAEVEQSLVNRMFRGGLPSNLSKNQIGQELKQERVQQAREEYFSSLREQAGVEIYLMPPRMEVDIDPSRVRGNPDAKITIVEFSDFQCPFCLRAYLTIKEILTKYEGKVRLAYRDMPLLGAQAGAEEGSGAASRCAGEQGKFWEYHDLLFQNQDYFGEEVFREFAEFLELDVNQFSACLESGKFQISVQEDFQEGLRLGIRGTPYFFINGIPVNGAQPKPVFEEIIEAELAAMER